MKDRYVLLCVLLLAVSGCNRMTYSTSESPSVSDPPGMSRGDLLHDYLPGPLFIENKTIDECGKNLETLIQNNKCRLIVEALAGSGEAALKLVTLDKGDTKIDWLEIAAEDGSLSGMEKIGSALFFTPFEGDPVGSRIRGRFWLQQATKLGSREAATNLEKADRLERTLRDDEHYSSNYAKNSEAIKPFAEAQQIRCGEHPKGWPMTWNNTSSEEGSRLRCEEIPHLQAQALGGVGRAAGRLQIFLSHFGEPQERTDFLYWNTIGAENGNLISMDIIGSWLYHKRYPGIIRGRFWLERAARNGSSYAKLALQQTK